MTQAAADASLVVHVDAATLDRSAAGQVLGAIHLSFGDRSFPDRDWSDYVAIILAWWIDAVVLLSNGKRLTAEWAFMDGPYHVEVARSEGGIAATMVRSGLRPTRRASATFPLPNVVSALRAAAETVLTGCAERGWSMPEVQELRLALKRLDSIAQPPTR